jgi:hypothetical protein
MNETLGRPARGRRRLAARHLPGGVARRARDWVAAVERARPARGALRRALAGALRGPFVARVVLADVAALALALTGFPITLLPNVSACAGLEGAASGGRFDAVGRLGDGRRYLGWRTISGDAR